MRERPFMDKSSKPTEQAMQSVLGNAYIYYKRAIDIADSYSQTWTFTKVTVQTLRVFAPNMTVFSGVKPLGSW